jgi:hypothetical protein
MRRRDGCQLGSAGRRSESRLRPGHDSESVQLPGGAEQNRPALRVPGPARAETQPPARNLRPGDSDGARLVNLNPKPAGRRPAPAGAAGRGSRPTRIGCARRSRCAASATRMREDTGRSESQRSESQRSESQRSESQRSESQRSESQRSESQRSESQRSESKRSESPLRSCRCDRSRLGCARTRIAAGSDRRFRCAAGCSRAPARLGRADRLGRAGRLGPTRTPSRHQPRRARARRGPARLGGALPKRAERTRRPATGPC